MSQPNNPTHIFRMSYYKNIITFCKDKSLYAKNYEPQLQYSISYNEINNRRGEEYCLCNGKTPHDMVAFYFSPLTAMQYTISQGNVDLKLPNVNNIATANNKDLIFFVAKIDDIAGKYKYVFTDRAANTANYQSWDNWNKYKRG